MRRYVIRRLLLSLPTLIGVTVVIFLLMRVVPGDPAITQLGDEGTRESHARLRKMLGLDRPLYQGYFVWIAHVVRGDFGSSYLSHRPVLEEIRARLPVSLQLGAMAIVVGLCVALPLGVLSAVRQNSVLDFAGRFVAISGLSIPSFWSATLVILIGSLIFRWTPPVVYSTLVEDPLANLKLVGVAALVLAYRIAGSKARMTRSATLEALRQDYVRTAWAKGLKERVVIVRHVLKNAMIPVVTLLGNEVLFLIGGTVIVETIFSIPGMGRYLIQGIEYRDYPVVQGVVLIIATAVVIMNFLVDVSYGWFDPRIRYE